LLPRKELLRSREYRDIEGSLISPDAIDTPEKDGPLYLEKRLNYVYLLHQLRPWSVLEIGFNWGYSASLIMESNPAGSFKSIDIAHHWYTRPAGDQMAQLYPGRFSFAWRDSHDALREEQASGREYDAIIVDGDRGYETARQHIHFSIALLKPGGLRVIDDTDGLT
jgi:predicted O-methyltransferase YrrM